MASFSNSDLAYMFFSGLKNGTIGTIGAKGDPGGITLGTNLGTNDLNTITSPGTYYTTNGANTVKSKNYPANTGIGVLIVLSTYPDNTRIEQEWRRITGSAVDSKLIYKRTLYSGTWSGWVAFNSTRTDETAGRAIYQWDELNNREQLIYGDTGWRDVRDFLLSGSTAVKAQIRRIGWSVTLQFQGVSLPTSNINDNIYLLPSGFTGDNVSHVPLRETIATGRMGDFELNTGAFKYWTPMDGGAQFNTTTHKFSGSVTVQTSSNWPTTLPGTAVGTIPNL